MQYAEMLALFAKATFKQVDSDTMHDQYGLDYPADDGMACDECDGYTVVFIPAEHIAAQLYAYTDEGMFYITFGDTDVGSC